MAYTRKTYDTFELRADYGYGHGFECIDCGLTFKSMLESRKVYRENGDQSRMKIVHKRVKIGE